MSQHGSILTQPNGSGKVTKSREGNKDTLKVVCVLKPRDAQSVTSLTLKRELESVRRKLRNSKTGQHENKRENAARKMTEDERITHERTGHATYDLSYDTCHQVRGVSTHLRKAFAEAAYFHNATVKNSPQGAEVKILVSVGPRGETFARPLHRKSAKFEDLELS